MTRRARSVRPRASTGAPRRRSLCGFAPVGAPPRSRRWGVLSTQGAQSVVGVRPVGGRTCCARAASSRAVSWRAPRRWRRLLPPAPWSPHHRSRCGGSGRLRRPCGSGGRRLGRQPVAVWPPPRGTARERLDSGETLGRWCWEASALAAQSGHIYRHRPRVAPPSVSTLPLYHHTRPSPRRPPFPVPAVTSPIRFPPNHGPPPCPGRPPRGLPRPGGDRRRGGGGNAPDARDG